MSTIKWIRLSITEADNADNVFFDNFDEAEQPLSIELGANQIFPDAEKHLVEMQVGDEKTLNLSPEQSFGPYNEEAKQTLPSENLPEELRAPGTIVSAETENNQKLTGTVISVDDENAVIDFNHPLAGCNVVVKFQVVEN